MSKLKVYISSTFLDLEKERDLLIQRVQKGLSPFFELTNIMEHMEGDAWNRSDVDICLAEVRKADIYIILLGNRYGSSPEKYTNRYGKEVINDSGKSFTELEYLTACETLADKFYGIYKFEIIDQFFQNEKLTLNTDLGDSGQNEKHRLFKEKLAQTVSPIKIDSLEDLAIGINNKLTEFHNSYITKLDLKLTPIDKASIDRKDQLQNLKNIVCTSGAYVFLIEAENENDCHMEFTSRIQYEFTKKTPETDVHFIHSGLMGVSSGSDEEKILDKILRETSINIYGDVRNGASFVGLERDITTIKNVFIGFVVDSTIDVDDGDQNFVSIISSFIRKIKTILSRNLSYEYNFYFIIYVFTGGDDAMPANIPGYFSDVNCFKIGRLPDVTTDNIVDWLKEIKTKREHSLTEDIETLFRLLFLSKDRFPTKYKQCIKMIAQRSN